MYTRGISRNQKRTSIRRDWRQIGIFASFVDYTAAHANKFQRKATCSVCFASCDTPRAVWLTPGRRGRPPTTAGTAHNGLTDRAIIDSSFVDYGMTEACKQLI